MSSFFGDDVASLEATNAHEHLDSPHNSYHLANLDRQGQLNSRKRYRDKNGSDDDDDSEGEPVVQVTGSRVGLRLLEGMHKAHAQQPSTSTSSTMTDTQRMRVVEAYVPLSVGGFMDGCGEMAEDLLAVRTGDIMCLRGGKGRDAPDSKSTQQRHQREQEGKQAKSEVTKSSSLGMSFVKETALTEEERLYGKHVTSDMTTELFEVGRVDRSTNSLEAIFLDGTRQKLKVHAVRPAGFVEKELFRRWRSDPASRPVHTIYAAEPKDAQTLSEQTAKTLSSPWWVTPQLIVRVVQESAGELFGKKFLVRSVLRKEGRIRIEPFRSDSNAIASASLPVDIVGCDAVETVVPKMGEGGIMVLGPMRGELVTVLARRRNADGELAALQVSSTRTGKEFSAEPHEVCQLALPNH